MTLPNLDNYDLFAWRQRLSISQREAAAMLDKSLRTYTRYETGESRVPRYIPLACTALENMPEKARRAL